LVNGGAGISVTFRIPEAGQSVGPSKQKYGTPRWVPPGTPIQIGSFTIPGGAIYVGKKLKSIATWVGSGVIDTDLDFELGHVDRTVKVGYYPSYERLTTLQRGAYLQWLASGKVDDYEDQWCLFLFLYGLEYRVLGEIDMAENIDELAAIHSEVDALLSRFSHRASFRHYAQSFLGFIDVVLLSLGHEPPTRVSAAVMRLSRLDVRAELEVAVLAKRRIPMTADLALQIVRAHPLIRLRIPARRCRPQFDQLFTERYAKRFAGELPMLVPSRKQFVLEYYPAAHGPQLRSIRFERSALGQDDPIANPPILKYVTSDSYSSNITVRIADLHPAIDFQEPPPAGLQALADECQDALSKYSRYLAGKVVDPDKAFALLPAELRRDRTSVASKIDLNVVAELLADDDVTTMLGERLGEEEAAQIVPATVALGNCDERAIVALIATLSQRSSWTKDEASELAQTHGFDFWGLAMSHMNEYALDHAGAILVEGDDLITIDEEILEELGHG
jgi:hypothetical protein